jgi:predicted HTH transcriptional regulator
MLRVKLSQKSQPESSSERVDKAVSYIRKHPKISARKTATIFKVDASSISKRLAGKTRSSALVA